MSRNAIPAALAFGGKGGMLVAITFPHAYNLQWLTHPALPCHVSRRTGYKKLAEVAKGRVTGMSAEQVTSLISGLHT
jgi:hypothetical protein